MVVKYDMTTTKLSALGDSPWDFSLVDGFSLWVAKEFQASVANPSISFTTLILLDTNGQQKAVGVPVPVNTCQFPDNTQGEPANLGANQLTQLLFDFRNDNNLDMSSIARITIRMQDFASTSFTLYGFVDKLETVRL